MEKQKMVEALTGGIAGLFAFFANLTWELIFIWIILMTIDIVTGIIKAGKEGGFKSREMKLGLLRKVGEFFLMVALLLGERVLQLIGINIPVASVFIGAFCFKEISSILENAIGTGINIPPVITKWFKDNNKRINTIETKEENQKEGE
ncbi:phage holin family protein [Vallitalea guaymasensis]|uniref:phage holin family protein n=1 Tax=Vallitalea guaymasensis TaxID=1185412 RepID=UPI000DE5196E|nr:phage holin family protein [Vallitalea guaymasensis]